MNRRVSNPISGFLHRTSLKRGAAFGLILLAALLAFEVFNYSTTDFALTDLLGENLRFLGVRWATILSIAFCGIDFAGIARLFTPEHGKDEPAEVWYLFGAWLLAAMMNATLTWWGVAVAVRTHATLTTGIISQNTLLKAIPIFVAVMVWLIRVLIIGTFSMAGERLFSMPDGSANMLRTAVQGERTTYRPATSYRPVSGQTVRSAGGQASTRPPSIRPDSTSGRSEPTYHPVSLSASPSEQGRNVRE